MTTATTSPVLDDLMSKIKQRVSEAFSGKIVCQAAKQDTEAKIAVGVVPTLPEKLAAFVQLKKWQDQIDELLGYAKEQSELLASPIMEEMAECGMQNANVGGMCVFTASTKFVSKKKEFSTAQICALLTEVGLGDLVANDYSAASLKSRVLEKIVDAADPDNVMETIQEVAARALPEKLAAAINVGEVKKLTARKA